MHGPALGPPLSVPTTEVGNKVTTDSQTFKTSIFDRLSMPTDHGLVFEEVSILQHQNETMSSYASKLQPNGHNTGKFLKKLWLIRIKGFETEEVRDQFMEKGVEMKDPRCKGGSDKQKDAMSDPLDVERIVESTKTTANTSAFPSRSTVNVQSKGDLLSSVREAFTKANRGRLNTTPFSVLMDLDEEGSILHGLHGDDEVGNTTVDVESQVPGKSGTPPNVSS
ncbi:hypothetical protein L6452_18951 [Arctium lappa]|uniref:Uncharacterized protein n=1 Tax=Arctium lappa TaxID=4217 RepID=A0ACB9B7C3_ARCLA|nr:hypothetical protein L6452_18951 [Arctium lappa]